MIINRLSLMKMNERPLSPKILEQIYICMNSPLPSVPNRIEVLDVGHWTDWKSVTTSFVRPLITLTAYELFSTQHLLHVNTYSFDFRTNLARFCQHPTQKKSGMKRELVPVTDDICLHVSNLQPTMRSRVSKYQNTVKLLSFAPFNHHTWPYFEYNLVRQTSGYLNASLYHLMHR